jgi:hypothetical protein
MVALMIEIIASTAFILVTILFAAYPFVRKIRINADPAFDLCTSSIYSLSFIVSSMTIIFHIGGTAHLVASYGLLILGFIGLGLYVRDFKDSIKSFGIFNNKALTISVSLAISTFISKATFVSISKEISQDWDAVSVYLPLARSMASTGRFADQMSGFWLSYSRNFGLLALYAWSYIVSPFYTEPFRIVPVALFIVFILITYVTGQLFGGRWFASILVLMVLAMPFQDTLIRYYEFYPVFTLMVFMAYLFLFLLRSFSLGENLRHSCWAFLGMAMGASYLIYDLSLNNLFILIGAFLYVQGSRYKFVAWTCVTLVLLAFYSFGLRTAWLYPDFLSILVPLQLTSTSWIVIGVLLIGCYLSLNYYHWTSTQVYNRLLLSIIVFTVIFTSWHLRNVLVYGVPITNLMKYDKDVVDIYKSLFVSSYKNIDPSIFFSFWAGSPFYSSSWLLAIIGAWCLLKSRNKVFNFYSQISLYLWLSLIVEYVVIDPQSRFFYPLALSKAIFVLYGLYFISKKNWTLILIGVLSLGLLSLIDPARTYGPTIFSLPYNIFLYSKSYSLIIAGLVIPFIIMKLGKHKISSSVAILLKFPSFKRSGREISLRLVGRSISFCVITICLALIILIPLSDKNIYPSPYDYFGLRENVLPKITSLFGKGEKIIGVWIYGYGIQYYLPDNLVFDISNPYNLNYFYALKNLYANETVVYLKSVGFYGVLINKQVQEFVNKLNDHFSLFREIFTERSYNGRIYSIIYEDSVWLLVRFL